MDVLCCGHVLCCPVPTTAYIRHSLRPNISTVSEILPIRNRPGSPVRDIELGKNEGQGML